MIARVAILFMVVVALFPLAYAAYANLTMAPTTSSGGAPLYVPQIAIFGR